MKCICNDDVVACDCATADHEGGAMSDGANLSGEKDACCTCPPSDDRTHRMKCPAMGWRPEDGDTRCQQCGGPNCVWVVDSAFWNEVMPDDGVLCIACFTERADRVLPPVRIWRLVPEFQMLAGPPGSGCHRAVCGDAWDAETSCTLPAGHPGLHVDERQTPSPAGG